MRRSTLWIILIAAGIMGAAVYWYQARQTMEAYERFTSEKLHVSFDYPKGWQPAALAKEIGSFSGEVQVFGPQRQDLKYSPYIDVSAQPVAGVDELQQAVNQALAVRGKQRSYKILEEKQRRCAGEAGMEVLAGYELQLPMNDAKRKGVQFRERVTYILKDGQLFRLAYAAPADDFDRFLHAYRHLTASLRFLSP